MISGNRQNRNRVDLSEDQNPRSHVQNDLGSPSLAFNIISTCFAKTKQGSWYLARDYHLVFSYCSKIAGLF